MTVNLSPEIEEKIRQKIEAGEFSSPEAVIERAVSRLEKAERSCIPSPLSKEERQQAWADIAKLVDSEGPVGVPPLSDDDLSRESIYDDERHRI